MILPNAKCGQYKWRLIWCYHTAVCEIKTKLFMLKCRYYFQPSVNTWSNSNWSSKRKEGNPAVAERETPALGDNWDCQLDKTDYWLRGIGGTFCVPLQNTTESTLANVTQLRHMQKMRNYLQITENGLLYRTQLENKTVSLFFSTEFRQVIKVSILLYCCCFKLSCIKRKL